MRCPVLDGQEGGKRGEGGGELEENKKPQSIEKGGVCCNFEFSCRKKRQNIRTFLKGMGKKGLRP